MDLKTTAMTLVQAAKQGPQQGQQSMETFLENLEAYQPDQLGEHADVQGQLVEAGKALEKLYAESGSAADIDAQVAKIEELAGQLPGEVEFEEEADQGD